MLQPGALLLCQLLPCCCICSSRFPQETDDIGFRKKLQRVTESSATPSPKAGTKVQDNFAAASCELLHLHKTCEPEPPSTQNYLLVFGLSTPMASDH